MVRVLMCHSFKQQKVFSDAYEPTSISCSVLEDLVFVATSLNEVFVYSLLEDGFPLVHRFPSVSLAKEIIFSNVGNYILTREATRKDKPSYCTARVYVNWSKWRQSEGSKMKIHQVGYSVTRPATSSSPEPESETLTAVEILSRFAVCALSCCPTSGNVAVATETAVSLYKVCWEGPFDLQRLYVVEPGFCIQKLAICEQFVAFTSASEVRVLRVALDGQSVVEQNLAKDGFKSETEQFLSRCVLSNSVTQREVFDEQFVIWSFDGCAEPSSEQTFADSLASNEWHDSELLGPKHTPCVVELPLIKEEVPCIDYSEKSCEVLGPVKMVHGHPLKVQGTLSNVQHVTMLYRYFEVDGVKDEGDVMPELHTIQLIPFYANDYNENDERSSPALEISSPKLFGMTCLVSSPKEGFVYDVFTKTELLAHCTYTSDTKTAAIAENLLYAVTSQTVETYCIPVYAVVAKHARSNRPSDFSDKLLMGDLSETEKQGVNLETDFGDTNKIPSDVGDGGIEVSGTDGDTKDTDARVDDLDQKSAYNYFGYPVYDIDILQKPCPSPCSDLYLIGVHQFSGVYFIMTAGESVLMLSSTTNLSSKHHSKKEKTKKFYKLKDWTLHVLKAMNMETLYSMMDGLTGISGHLNAQADLRLLKEQHMILRTQFQAGHMSQNRRNSLLLSLGKSVKHLGDYYASFAVDDVEEVMLYYTMADLSFENIVDQHIEGRVEVDKVKDRKFGKGLVFYLNEVLFQRNQEKITFTLPQVTADKVLYIYSNADPTRLSMLILRRLIEGYTPELAVKLLTKLKKTKSYSFSTEDHLALAIVYLKICELELAGEELFNLPKEKLADICVKHHYILYEKDETTTPLGQLLRRRLPKVFIKTLVLLHFRGITSLTNTVELLQGKGSELYQNTHLLEYLELVVSDQRGKKSFKEARELLVEIYFQKLSKRNEAQVEREILRFPHYHIPKSSGHFSKRFSWLDKLPPFNGCVSEPKDCPFVKVNVSAASSPRGNWLPGFSRTRAPRHRVDDKKTKETSCRCCCCWETLLKLQSLLCSRYCDEEFGNFVLSNLVGRTLPGYISITLLCLPLIGEHEKAVESLLAAEPSAVLTYSKQFFDNSYIKWQCVLNVITERIRSGNHSDTTYNTYKEILQETLVILSTCTTPKVFLSLLPVDGNFAFFLPFLLQCYQKNAAKNLSDQIMAK